MPGWASPVAEQDLIIGFAFSRGLEMRIGDAPNVALDLMPFLARGRTFGPKAARLNSRSLGLLLSSTSLTKAPLRRCDLVCEPADDEMMATLQFGD
ncbi:hypothetical protein XI09_15140 [Bradyrhizobium sp. CCBAU 11386]|nr:hypothetical protein [Bradyrhizobium sp. CCBAU 11361]MDA9505942.1 hypothetical protein [Bradyrhizobium sp. CCBAU 11386]